MVIAVYKTVHVSSKRVKTEVSDEYDTVTPTGNLAVTGTHSPCRVNTYRCDDGEELGFRTQKEQDDLMIDEVRDEFDYEKWKYVGQTPELYKSYSPVPIRKTRRALAVKQRQESERLAVAMRKMMGGKNTEPNSPVYDYWNLGYAKVFEDAIQKTTLLDDDEERMDRKRKRTHGVCEESCHWCVNRM